ncbi:MAG: hypothetical protein ACI9VN_003960 [Patescibacteria group bacterium]|jgi:uncharacterized protein (TIGR02145 family)
MKSFLPIFFFFFFFFFTTLGLWTVACTNSPTKNENLKKTESTKAESLPVNAPKEKAPTIQPRNKITDLRDGETYTTVFIGRQVWLAENLRFKAPGSILNPENPSKYYGRFYELKTAQTACPQGWHLPSDSEWDELERAHGMPASFIGKGGWRGEHAPKMRSTTGWEEDGNGTNSWGFNVLPAGYYFTEKVSEEMAGIDGLGFSAAFWSAVGEDGKGFARFMFSSRDFVNKWGEGLEEDMGTALSCRCVKD